MNTDHKPDTIETHDEMLRRERARFEWFNAHRRRVDPCLFIDEIVPVTDPLEPRRVVREHTRSCLTDCAPST